MKQYISYQIGGVVAFVLVSVTAFMLSGYFGEGYVFGLVFGFGIGLSMTIFQYGIVVETEAKSRGYRATVAEKIDSVFEGS